MTRSRVANRARNSAPMRRIVHRETQPRCVREELECGHVRAIPTGSFPYNYDRSHRGCKECSQ